MSKFYVWIDNPTTQILNADEYFAENERIRGFANNEKISSKKMNTAIRQASLITVALMEALEVSDSINVASSISEVKAEIIAGLNALQPSIDLSDYVKNTDYAGFSNYGVVKLKNYCGIRNDDGIYIDAANKANIDDRVPNKLTSTALTPGQNNSKPIVPATFDYAVKQSLLNGFEKLSKSIGNGTTYDGRFAWTDEEKALVRANLGITGGGSGGTQLYRHTVAINFNDAYDQTTYPISFLSTRSAKFENNIVGYSSEMGDDGISVEKAIYRAFVMNNRIRFILSMDTNISTCEFIFDGLTNDGTEGVTLSSPQQLTVGYNEYGTPISAVGYNFYYDNMPETGNSEWTITDVVEAY